MTPSLTLILQALAFVSVILAVEGLYLLLRSANRRERAVNRRMQIAAARRERVLDPELFRKEVEGGSVSGVVSRIIPGFNQLVRRSAVRATPAQLVGVMAIIGVVAFLCMALVFKMTATGAASIAAALGFAGPYLYLSMAASARVKKFNEQLPVAIDIMVRGLQVGHPVPVAIEMVAREVPDPIGSEFGAALDEMNYGKDRGAALAEIATRFPSSEYRFLVSAIDMQKETGGNLAEILTNLSRVIRERANMRKKIAAVSAEGKITCYVVGGLPFAVSIAILILNPAFFLDVANDPLFLPMIGGGFVSWALGVTWIWRMVNFKI